MHETSLVRSLLHQVDRIAREHGARSVTCIEVEIGPLSGVEALLVRSAFELLISNTPWPGAELVIETVPLDGCCIACGAEFTLACFDFRCLQCSSASVRITRGDEFRLLNVTIETAQPLEAAS